MDWLKLGVRQLLRYIGLLLLIITHYFFGTDGCNPHVLSRQALGTSEMPVSVLARVWETSWRPFAYSLGLLLKWEIIGRLSFPSSAVAFLVLFSWFDFRKSGEVCINSVMWPARSHVTGCLEYQDEIFYEFSQPPLRFDDAMLTRNKVFNGESLMRGMERRIWQ